MGNSKPEKLRKPVGAKERGTAADLTPTDFSHATLFNDGTQSNQLNS